MSQEVFELVRGMNGKSIETQLAMQCAPVIMGLKTSNLLIIQKENVSKVWKILKGSGICAVILLVREKKITLLLYQPKQLERYLSDARVIELLRQLGYKKLEFSSILFVFKKRYAKYCQNGGVFPHEIGLLLGYPVEDVRGFIENEGENFLYTGYWKVYENIKEKLYLFKKFELAKEILIQEIAGGKSMEELIRRQNMLG